MRNMSPRQALGRMDKRSAGERVPKVKRLAAERRPAGHTRPPVSWSQQAPTLESVGAFSLRLDKMSPTVFPHVIHESSTDGTIFGLFSLALQVLTGFWGRVNLAYWSLAIWWSLQLRSVYGCAMSARRIRKVRGAANRTAGPSGDVGDQVGEGGNKGALPVRSSEHVARAAG